VRHRACRCGNEKRDLWSRLTLGAVAAALLVWGVPAAAGARAPAVTEAVTTSATIVVHGPGRVVSDPPGEIDCPGRCTVSFATTRTLRLRATAPDGHTIAGWIPSVGGGCGEVTECTLALGNFDHTIHVHVRPTASLQLWPNGDGVLTVSPAGTDARGDAADAACTRENALAGTGCILYYVPGTEVTVSATAPAGGAFLGWSAHHCRGTSSCRMTPTRAQPSLVGRFTPLEVRVIRGGDLTGRVVSEPSGISCPPTCAAPFPAGTRVTLVAQPDAAAPFLSWKFGCTPAATDPRRCTLLVTNNPTWAGVALGADEPINPPTNLAVLFDVTREGRGTVVGRSLDCGRKCEHRYPFGTQEELWARPAAGWRFTGWRGACAPQATCRLHVGPVTSVAALFRENLAPRLLSVSARRTGAERRVGVRVSVRAPAQARLRLRRHGSEAFAADRRYRLGRGTTTLVLPVPAGAPAGRYRLVAAVADGAGGGRTFVRDLRLAP